MNLRPIKDQIVVLPDPPVAQLGVIVIPETVLADNPNYFNMTGTVVALGAGVRRHVFQCINCQALAPQDDGPCPGCHQPLGNFNARLFDADLERHPFDVQVGERVLFNRYAGKQITCEDDRTLYLVMREVDVLGVVTDAHQVLPGYMDAGDAGVQSLKGDRKL